MPTLRVIRRRIRSIRNTAKITRAMEMIATSKMRRTQLRVLAARPYAEKIREVIAHLATLPPSEEGASLHPLLERRPVKRIAVVHITADRGLCGGLNSNMNRLTAGFIPEQSAPVSVVAVGRKGRDFVHRAGHHLLAEFTNLGDRPSAADLGPISRIIIDDYISKEVDEVYLAYTRFVSTMTQRPIMEKLLPLEPPVDATPHGKEYIYEPAPQHVLAHLLPRYVEMLVYHAMLEAIASEQSARMVAMRSATDNANEMIQDLTLVYNKARQEAITKELLDLVGGAAVLEEK